MKDERAMKKYAGPGRVVFFFLLSIALIVIGIIVIVITFGTTLGRILLVLGGVTLILIGSVVMYNGIRDIIGAIRSDQ